MAGPGVMALFGAAGWRHLRDYLRYQALPEGQHALVVYSEGPAYWPHLGPVVQAFLQRHALPLAYVSSSPDDPGLSLRHEQLHCFQIGEGATRTLFFQGLRARRVLLTMPDLDSFHLKRSRQVGAYVYLHHSLVSLHMAYRDHAFDAYDVMLCAGPHHASEMRALAALHGRPPPRLVAHGYARVDALLQAQGPPRPPGPPRVVVAPSWGPQGLLECHADALMSALAHCGWQVQVRPHPQTLRLWPRTLDALRAWCASAGNLHLDDAFASQESLLWADVMISDWSGAAFDFALGLGRPVLFIDVPRKVNNPRHEQLGLEPVEVAVRTQLGQLMQPSELAHLPARLDALRQRQVDATACRARWLHHPGRSAEVAADWLADEMTSA